MSSSQRLLLSEAPLFVVQNLDITSILFTLSPLSPLNVKEQKDIFFMMVYFCTDPLLHLWEVTPNSKEILFLAFSFSLASPPSLMVSTRDRLCVARNNPELSSYTLDLFNIATKGWVGHSHIIRDILHACV